MKRADGRQRGHWVAGSLMVALLALSGAQAEAQLTSALDSTTGATCSGGGSGDGDCRNSAAFTVSCGASCSTFTSRYAWNINADTTALSTHDTSGNAQHNIPFDATAVGGYRLDSSTSRVGALGRSADASGCDGSADTSGVTGNSNVAIAADGGSLGLGDPGVIGNGGGDSNSPHSQSDSSLIVRFSGSVAQSHSLSFTWNGSVRSNSCEASVRQGESSGTTTGCDVCGYPGNPSRTQSSDGHFVTVTLTSLCGNGAVEAAAGEDCDTGIAGSVCCGANCKFLTSSTTCRGAAGECDVAEVCSGTSATCPPDVKKASGTACTADSNPCTLDQCDGTSVTCQHPAGNAGAVCRPTAGVCDVAETCTGASTTCPADGFASSATPCRPTADECDLAENCTGSGPSCPADAKKASGTACTDDGNPCTTDQCDGTNVTCQHPAGNAGAVCRPAAGEGGEAEAVRGGSGSCRAAGVVSSSAFCRPAAGGGGDV